MNRPTVFVRCYMGFCILLFLSIHGIRGAQDIIQSNNVGVSIKTGRVVGARDGDLATMPLFQFVCTELKRPEYAREILPYDFSYLHQLLVYGKTLQHRQNYARSVFGIFSNVMGASHEVSAYAFEALLELLPNALKPYTLLSISSELPPYPEGADVLFQDRFKHIVSNILFVQFSSRFDSFKAEPVLFFDDLAHRISDVAQQEIDMQLMRTAIKRFTELALSKLIWRSEKPETIWPSVKKIADNLMQLVEHNIIDDLNDLNDMYWTLIHRFNYFTDLLNAHLPQSFYQDIRTDLSSDSILLLTLAEQDSCIRTKKECLMRALVESEAKKLAYEKGIVLP